MPGVFICTARGTPAKPFVHLSVGFPFHFTIEFATAYVRFRPLIP